MITIRGYSPEEFRDYLERQEPRYGIEATMLHHTYKPDADSYQGLQTIRNIQSYHRNRRKWRDIGASAYTAPDGRIYNGRPLDWGNYAHAYMKLARRYWPAELQELAGNDRNWLNRHGFGIETVGNFDSEDPTQSPAMQTALDVAAMVHDVFDVPLENLFFHRDVAYKSCPGSRVSHEWVNAEMQKRMQGLQVKLLPGSKIIDCNPVEEGGVTRGDIRPLAEALGYEVMYHPEDQAIYLRKEDADAG